MKKLENNEYLNELWACYQKGLKEIENCEAKELFKQLINFQKI